MAKKRRRRERRRAGAGERDVADLGAPAAASQFEPKSGQQSGLPSPVARIAGVVLAIVTVVIAVLTVISALSDDLAAADVGLRLFAGLFLIALAIVIAALSLVPGFVRRMIAGGR